MFIGVLNITAAIILSLVSMYFSITGITTIFAGASIGVMLMGAALEFSKIAATVWLHSWWKKASKILKYYLIFAVTILIVISSIGIYGYLSRAYVGQQGPAIQLESQMSRIDQQINRYQRDIDRTQAEVDLLDQSIAIYLEYDNATRGLQQLENQEEQREELYAELDRYQDQIDELLDQRFEIENQINTTQTDVGPIRYIAALIYGEDDAESNYDNAARILILLLVIVFDPFAVLMMVSGNIAIENSKPSSTKAQRKAAANARAAKAKKKKEKPVPELPMEETRQRIREESPFVDPKEIQQIKRETTRRRQP